MARRHRHAARPQQDGSVTESITDANGESSLLLMHELEKATIEVIKGMK